MAYLPSFRLLSERNFGLLWLAGLISILGDWALRVALPFYVLRLTASASAVSVVVLAGLVAGLAAGPFAGVIVDRLDRRRVLVWANAAQAAALIPVAICGPATPTWLAAAVAAVESALAEVAGPAASALLPRLVLASQVATANSLDGVANFTGRLVGPAIGGLVTATAGLTGSAAVDSSSFAAAALAYALITGRYRPAAKRGQDPDKPASLARTARVARLARELADGVTVIAGSRLARAVMIFIVVISIGEGMMSSLFAVWVSRALHLGGREMGWMLSAQAIGGIVGSVAGTGAIRRCRPVGLGCICMCLFGIGDLAIFNAPRWHTALWPLIALFCGIGIPAGIGYPALLTLFQLSCTDGYRGRMFALLGTAETAANIVGAAVAGTLGQSVSAVDLLTAQGAGFVLGAGLLRVLAGSGPRRLAEMTAEPRITGRRTGQTRSPSS